LMIKALVIHSKAATSTTFDARDPLPSAERR
jgi:hypothetical protein